MEYSNQQLTIKPFQFNMSVDNDENPGETKETDFSLNLSVVNDMYEIGDDVSKNIRNVHQSQNSSQMTDTSYHVDLKNNSDEGCSSDEKIPYCPSKYIEGESVTINVEWCNYIFERGNMNEQFDLGSMYYKGEGVDKNDTEALACFIKAGLQGHAIAQFSAGFMFEFGEGEGVQKDEIKAVEWYTRAADQKFPPAQFSLGVMYQQSRGILKNISKVVELFTEAAQKGHPKAQYNLGLLYYEGEGVERNIDMALYYFKEAANQGYEPARHSLNTLFIREEGQEPKYQHFQPFLKGDHQEHDFERNVRDDVKLASWYEEHYLQRSLHSSVNKESCFQLPRKLQLRWNSFIQSFYDIHNCWFNKQQQLNNKWDVMFFQLSNDECNTLTNYIKTGLNQMPRSGYKLKCFVEHKLHLRNDNSRCVIS
jgi:TPR repeat protein